MKVFSWFAAVLVMFSAAVAGGMQPISHRTAEMPIVQGAEKVATGRPPVPQRGPEFKKWLAPSIKIAVSVPGGIQYGSGTICYYDPYQKLAYVATCGHLWDKGVMTAEQGAKRNMTCKIFVFYHNENKLPTPKEYQAKVIFYSHVSGCDTGLITFTPDWVPEYFPIAPANYQIPTGSHQHSTGCDHATEVAHYDVEIIGIRGNDLVTQGNSPRPGRSGGGLLSDEGFYIGTCWGTSVKDGTGTGYFTPLSVIHNFWRQQTGYEFLLTRSLNNVSPARNIPIVDRNGPPGTYPKDYILLPKQ